MTTWSEKSDVRRNGLLLFIQKKESTCLLPPKLTPKNIHTELNLLFSRSMDSFLSKDYRQDCKYGENCYQRNPEHKAKFKHPELRAKKEEEKIIVEDDKENNENKTDNIVPSRKRLLSSSEGEDDVDTSKKLHTMSSSEDSQEDDIEDDAEDRKAASKENTTKEEFDDLLGESPKDTKEDIHLKYLINMPEDFFLFFDFCKTLSSASPLTALNVTGLKLCGPYDTLADNVPHTAPRSQRLYLTHGR